MAVLRIHPIKEDAVSRIWAKVCPWMSGNRIRKLFEILLPLAIAMITAVCITGGAYAVESGSEDNAAAYRVKPLQDKLASLPSEDIDRALAAYGDMGGHWSRKAVGKLACLEIIAGVDGKFLPENPVQVDQFIKMTVRAMGFTPGDDAKYWAQNYIDTAIGQKIIDKNEFKDYRRAITREEAARIIVKATLLKEEFPYKNPYNNPDILVRSKILDYAKISDANKQVVLQSYELGLITGANGRFMPANTLTRAEAATIILRYLDTASRVPFKPKDDEVYVVTNPSGTTFTVYPPPKMEVIKAANAFKTAYPKSKGYVEHLFVDNGHNVTYSFYESREVYERDSVTTLQMSLFLEVINWEYYMEYPYQFTIYDAAAVRRLHRDAVYEMFQFWFENDVDKAMAVFDRYIEYATNNDTKHRTEKITYNNRWMFIYKAGQDDGFSLSIYSQP